MKIDSKLQEIYKDSGIVIRNRVSGVFFVLAVTMAITPVTIVQKILDGDIVTTSVVTAIFILLSFSMAALFKGHYRFASITTLAFPQISMIALSFIFKPVTVYQVFLLTLYALLPIILSIVVSDSEWYTIVSVILGAITAPAAFFIKIVPVLTPEEKMLIPERLIVSGLLYLLISLFSIYLAKNSRRSMEFMEKTQREGERTIEKIKILAKTAEQSLTSNKSVEDNFVHILEGSSSIKKHLEDFIQISKDLSENMKEALSYVEDTTNQVENFDLQVEEQNTVVQESTAAVNQMSASLDSVAKITSAKRDTTNVLLTIAEDGMSAMKETNTAVETSAADAHALLEINKIVSDIADRTNLLSMNAAIEAAHAGERGKGFAVVADEIRKLAGSTAENSRIIADSLKKLIESMDMSKSHTEKINKIFEKLVTEIRLVSQAFSEITGSTAELSGGGQEIMKSMQVLQNSSMVIREGSGKITADQKNAKEKLLEVFNFIKAINEISGEITAAADGIANSTDSVNSLVRDSALHTREMFNSVSRLTEK